MADTIALCREAPEHGLTIGTARMLSTSNTYGHLHATQLQPFVAAADRSGSDRAGAPGGDDVGPQRAMTADALLSTMLARRSVSPRRLGLPAPSAEQLGLMVDAALRAPDHARLLPWRLVEFGDAQRAELAQLFEDEKRRRTPDPTPQDIERARAHATQTPTMLAFVVRPESEGKVPVHEQWLAAGAALGQLVLAAHAMGFGAIVLSGERCKDSILRAALGIAPEETLAGFVSIGTIISPLPPAARTARSRVLSSWKLTT